METRHGPAWLAGCGALVAAALGGACGGSQARRYDGMLVELGRTSQPVAPSHDDGAQLFVGATELDRGALVEAVLARNPDVAAARHAWRAALAEYPQASALADPMLSYEVAPLSISGEVPFGQRVALSQKLPWPGKRRLAGEVALAEAEAARGEMETVRLELALMASNLYDDLYAVTRSIEVNEQHHDLLRQLKKAAEAEYVAGRASQQDPLQAEVELGQLERDRIVLEAERGVVVAQLNGLLRREPSAPLPPPPAEQPARDPATAGGGDLADQAAARRPELRAQGARLRGARAAIDAAERERYPDLEVMGSYDSMWDMPEHQWMVGIGLDIPLQRAPRQAAIDQAQAMSARARSQDEQLRIQIRVEVERARVRAREGARVVRVIEERLLPAARDQVGAARAGFVTGKNEFAALITAENSLRRVELDLHHARADLSRRLAALDRALGRIPGLPEGRAK